MSFAEKPSGFGDMEKSNGLQFLDFYRNDADSMPKKVLKKCSGHTSLYKAEFEAIEDLDTADNTVKFSFNSKYNSSMVTPILSREPSPK